MRCKGVDDCNVTPDLTYCFFRDPYSWGSFRVDLNRYARLLKGQLREGPKALVTNATIEDLERLTSEGLPIAVDVETRPAKPEQPWTALDPTRAKLRTIGLGNVNCGLSVVWQSLQPAMVQAIARVIRETTTIWHNGPWYDHPILRRYGFRIGKWEDTRDARRALSSTSKLSLEFEASIYDDCTPWKEKEKNEEKVIFTEDLNKLQKYNAQDCVETARSWEGICKEADWQTTRVQRLYRLHKQQSVLAAEMYRTGFRIDFAERRRLAKELLALYEERKKALLAYVNVPGFKCNSNSMRSLLFKKHETEAVRRFSLEDPIEKKRYTKTGLIAVDLPNLLLVVCDPAASDELKKTVDLYWQAAAAWKTRSTYVATEKVEHAIGRDKRLRPGWNSCGTDTGRWSCQKPNVQNLSASGRNENIRGKLPDVRRMYVAAPGYVLVHFDKSQLELRVRAAVMNDLVLQQDLEAGDVYGRNAQDWFKLSVNDMKATIGWLDVEKEKPGSFSPEELLLARRCKQARFTCKTVHLASQYGAGDRKVYQVCLKDDRTMKFRLVRELHEGFKRRYEATVKYWFAEMKRVSEVGYSETLILQRRRVYPRPPDLTDTANYPIQGTAADIITLEMLKLRRRLRAEFGTFKKRNPILTHEHDALTLEVPKKYQQDVVKVVNEVCDRSYTINGRLVALPIEVKCGKRWSEV